MTSKIVNKNGKYDICDNIKSFKFFTTETLDRAEFAKNRIDNELKKSKPADGRKLKSPLGWVIDLPFSFSPELFIDTNSTREAAEARISELQEILDSDITL